MTVVTALVLMYFLTLPFYRKDSSLKRKQRKREKDLEKQIEIENRMAQDRTGSDERDRLERSHLELKNEDILEEASIQRPKPSLC